MELRCQTVFRVTRSLMTGAGVNLNVCVVPGIVGTNIALGKWKLCSKISLPPLPPPSSRNQSLCLSLFSRSWFLLPISFGSSFLLFPSFVHPPPPPYRIVLFGLTLLSKWFPFFGFFFCPCFDLVSVSLVLDDHSSGSFLSSNLLFPSVFCFSFQLP